MKLVFLQPADALSAFTQRQADAWAIWDPYTAQAEQQINVRSIGQAKDVTNGYWFGIASDQALADPKRNTALPTCWFASRRRRDGPRTTPSSGRRVTPPRSVSIRRWQRFRRAAACGCPRRSTTEVVASEQKLTDLFAHSGQIQATPKFADWVDRRYNDVLAPLLISTN